MDKEQQVLALKESETLLLRECLYALQGMNGNHFYFDKETDEFQCHVYNDAVNNPELVERSTLGSGAQDAFQQCGQAGWYYRRIQTYIEHHRADSHVARAWSEALSQDLHKSYHSLLADFEAMLQHDTTRLLLRQLTIRLVEPTKHLKILATLCDGCATLVSAGPLLSALHRHSNHGDAHHAKLVQGMLRAASQPWYQELYLWTTRGVLPQNDNDMNKNDFFIVQRKRGDHQDVWHSTFDIVQDQVPSILPGNLVQLSFNVGKSINFIRHCLQDAGWNMVLDGDEPATPESLGYAYESENLSSTLRLAEQQVNRHLVKSLVESHHVMQHLRALKQFMLLGQGDFYSVLMEGLHAEFGSRTGIVGLYDYALMGIVDGALKSTNATNLPTFVLERLRVKLLLDDDDDVCFQFGPPPGESDDSRTGWDIFSLGYGIPGPLAAIVHDRAMEQYQRVFRFLFDLKRVDFMLNLTWRQSTALHHAIQIFAQYNAIHMATNTEYGQATALLRHISMTRQAMMHFVVNLKSYLFFEVLEGAWKTLSNQLDTAKSLEEFIDAHDTYLADIIHKSLIGSDENDATDQDLGLELRTLLRLVLEFCTFQQDLFQTATQQAERATEKRKEAERRSTQGDWGFVSEQDVRDAKTFFGLTDPARMKQVTSIGRAFNQHTAQLLTRLHEMSNGYAASKIGSSADSVSTGHNRDRLNHDSLQFLTFQLDYSEFYTVNKATL